MDIIVDSENKKYCNGGLRWKKENVKNVEMKLQ